MVHCRLSMSKDSTPTWKLHPSAKESLNKQANELVAKIGPPPPEETYNPPSFPVERHPIADLDVSGPLQGGGLDTFGKRTSHFVVGDNRELGLYGRCPHHS